MSKFPEKFLWGASTSAYQFEGRSKDDKKGKSVMDVKKIPEGTTDFLVASDHINHWKEDVALMAEMGFKAYRFSVSWTRILPSLSGSVNLEGIEFYNNLIDELLKNNIEPIVTMYHFDLPLELENIGGWLNRRTIDEFERYADILFKNFGTKVKYWLTINEQNMVVLASSVISDSADKPKSENPDKDRWQINHHMMVAQARAINLCHKTLKTALIGPAPNIGSTYPASCKPEDYLAAANFAIVRNWTFLDTPVFGEYNKIFLSILKRDNLMFDYTEKDLKDIKEGKPDFISINYYQTATVEKPVHNKKYSEEFSQHTGFAGKDFVAILNGNLPKTQFGWEIDPLGFTITLREVYERYNLPIMISENGIGGNDILNADNTINDDYRIDYYKKHIKAMHEAISWGVKVFGYMPWSAIDLVSTHEGITKRYGFVFVNRDEFDLKDLKRYPKASFYWYKELIKINGESISE